jgi:hypothetical protein
VHRVLLYVFSILQFISFVTIVIIMTRKKETMKNYEPYLGAIYKDLRYESHRIART